MEFSVGDKVIHPQFGAGQITGEEHREPVNGFKHYFVIRVLGTGATAYVPIRNMDELGVRLVMSWDKLVQVLFTLRSVPSALSNDYKERQALVQEKMGRRLPVAMAETVRDLTWRKECNHLTQKDQALLKRARELLATEMALATDADVMDTHKTIDGTLKTAVERGFDELECTSNAAKAAASTPGIQVQDQIQNSDHLSNEKTMRR